jgi:hypothetical protein
MAYETVLGGNVPILAWTEGVKSIQSGRSFAKSSGTPSAEC